MEKNFLFYFCVASLLLIGLLSIQIIKAEPTLVFDFGTSGTGNNELSNPSDIGISSSGDIIYIADTDNNRINAFDDEGDHLFKFGTFCDMLTDQGCNDNAPDANEDGDGQFNEPFYVTVDSFGDVYITDSQNNRVQRFDSSGDFEIKFGSSNQNDDDFLGVPSGIAIQQSSRDIYVADSDENSISVFDSSGDFLFSFGSTGSGEGEFREPLGIIIDDSEELLYVADSDNDRIQIFELVDGTTCPQDTEEIVDGVCFVEEFGSTGTDEGEFLSPRGLSIDTTNNLLYVVDTGNDRIHVYQTSTTQNNTPNAPTNIAADPASPTSIVLTWNAPALDEDVPQITGYKIEYKTGSDDFATLVSNTQSTSTSFLHEGLDSEETYTYRVYAINSAGTSNPSSQSSAKPGPTTVPSGLTATAVSPNQIRLSWNPPSETFGQSISGYTIQREVIPGVYDTIADVGSGTTTYTVGGLETGKTYTYVVFARFTLGASDVSNTASATPTEDSSAPSSPSVTVPTSPRSLSATALSETQIKLSWSAPTSDGNSPITGYKIESKKGNENFSVIETTQGTSTTFTDTGLTTGTTYTYRVSAINSVGTSNPSGTAFATPSQTTLALKPLGQFTIDEGKTLSFLVGITDSSLTGLEYRLGNNSPQGAKINSNTGLFSWTPTNSQGTNTYTFSIIVEKDDLEDRQTVTITVNDVAESPTQPQEPEPTNIPDFVDPEKGAQYYLDRYNNEANYKAWFDSNYPDYTIEEAIELAIPDAFSESKEVKPILPFVDPNQDPQRYIDRYNNEPSYKAWFDSNYPDYTIYEAVGVEQKEPKTEEPEMGVCGEGTVYVDGYCERVETTQTTNGCLIATAAFDSELSPQVQQLRELRDKTVLRTSSGSAFMESFNEFYYLFSPTVSDWERQSPIFKEAVKVSITPLLTSLSLLNLVDIDSDYKMMVYGAGIILLNFGLYAGIPIVVIHKTKNKLKTILNCKEL